MVPCCVGVAIAFMSGFFLKGPTVPDRWVVALDLISTLFVGLVRFMFDPDGHEVVSLRRDGVGVVSVSSGRVVLFGICSKRQEHRMSEIAVVSLLVVGNRVRVLASGGAVAVCRIVTTRMHGARSARRLGVGCNDLLRAIRFENGRNGQRAAILILGFLFLDGAGCFGAHESGGCLPAERFRCGPGTICSRSCRRRRLDLLAVRSLRWVELYRGQALQLGWRAGILAVDESGAATDRKSMQPACR